MSGEEARRGGYGSPPAEHQFKKGFSGNPRGRPRGRETKQPRPHLYDELVPIPEDGRVVQIPRGELLVRLAEKRAREGDDQFADLLLKLKKKVDAARRKSAYDECEVTGDFKATDSPPKTTEQLLVRLGMAVKLYAFRSTARMALEPWLVQDALSRVGETRFTREQQEIIVKATHRAHKVRWPEWWEPDLRGTKRRYRKRR